MILTIVVVNFAFILDYWKTLMLQSMNALMHFCPMMNFILLLVKRKNRHDKSFLCSANCIYNYPTAAK
ncbi:hypothetical protein DWZ40_02825 [Clostridium sp. AF32-12BH]|nr:hypothetical protein DWZ40_02825 [Clostridium sp. AF32-12BH]